MKILFASSSSGSRGGGEMYLLYLGRALVDRGHEVQLWVSDHERMNEVADAFAKFGKVTRSRYQNTYDRKGRSIAASLDGATARKVADEWRRAGADIIHINKQNLEDGLDLLNAAQRLDTPSVCTIHISQSADFLKARFAGIRDFVSRRALRKYRGMLVTVLESRARDLERFLGTRDGQRTIVNGVPLFDLAQRAALRAAKRAELGINEDGMLVLAVGRLVPQKRPMHFLDRAAQLAQALPHARFVWIGDGPLGKEWDLWVREHKMEGIVQRVGWQADVAPFLAAGDGLMHVAEFEGLPLAILEAMSASLPCAITENLLTEMPFLNSSNSIAIRANTAWMDAFKHPADLATIGAQARLLIEREFSFRTMAEAYESLYFESLKLPLRQ